MITGRNGHTEDKNGFYVNIICTIGMRITYNNMFGSTLVIINKKQNEKKMFKKNKSVHYNFDDTRGLNTNGEKRR